ncbi:MAG: Mrp/NBP35 family ATP-binding protein [Clostridia bacterium]|nr:Mrp/NBP35 family ATP-binding protein [Clostridia bacterium]MBR4979033.1 Mrp/NBP35 family ATP-binding protein [Clostridia bacterium]
MSEECTHNCSTCSENCSSRTEPQSFIEPLNPHSSVKKVIGIVSGKGGVGKSMVTSMLAVLMSRKGYNTAILDADVTGPSIPKAFGVSGQVTGYDGYMTPKISHGNIKIMSSNLLLESEDTPVIWRGPIIAGAVKQFWTDTIWEDVDFMFVDMPPGTGDVPLTVFQSIPLDGIIIVTSPQELVSLVVSKAVNMAKKMNIPIIGVIENMSYVTCPDCGKVIEIFGKSKSEQTAREQGVEFLARMPIDPSLAALCDSGEIEKFSGNYLENVAQKLESSL